MLTASGPGYTAHLLEGRVTAPMPLHRAPDYAERLDSRHGLLRLDAASGAWRRAVTEKDFARGSALAGAEDEVLWNWISAEKAFRAWPPVNDPIQSGDVIQSRHRCRDEGLFAAAAIFESTLERIGMTREEAIVKATEVLVRCYAPERIYLIGSSARGDAAPGSDLDFVVVVPDDTPPGSLWGRGVHEQLWEVPFGVEIAPFRRSTFERRSDWLMSLPAIALREGRLVYESRRQAA